MNMLAIQFTTTQIAECGFSKKLPLFLCCVFQAEGNLNQVAKTFCKPVFI